MSESPSSARNADSETSFHADVNAESKTGEVCGVLLVGHGTRDPRGTEEFFQLGEKLAERMSHRFAMRSIVQPCLLEFQSPTIEEGWRNLIDAGAGRIVIAPLLLFAAGHAKSDIPDEIRRVAEITGTLDRISGFSRPLSRQSELIRLVRNRLVESLGINQPSNDPKLEKRTAVVMVGRGSLDPCASSDMRLLTEVALRGKPVIDEIENRSAAGLSLADAASLSSESVATTFYAMAEPRLPDTLRRIGKSGRFDRIIVQPHLLFSGRLYDAIVRQTEEAGDEFDEIEFVVSRYLGPVKEVADAILARVEEVVNHRVQIV
ncbi:sirohydrochlorin chelatase [Rhodopirellula halodulae]|uniref:sirohydrochlorin chelatase n=1 Tax=Rhodopirellula halodulae TaxID=2894198 RepID=UPI001E43BB36|nr:sirohydrochlorin chelatase [Rhodopirellula sp. JC737]MCC9657518.1 sirohydrochlorin chelatase [Rhodopirellula sp. JC737]